MGRPNTVPRHGSLAARRWLVKLEVAGLNPCHSSHISMAALIYVHIKGPRAVKISSGPSTTGAAFWHVQPHQLVLLLDIVADSSKI